MNRVAWGIVLLVVSSALASATASAGTDSGEYGPATSVNEAAITGASKARFVKRSSDLHAPGLQASGGSERCPGSVPNAISGEFAVNLSTSFAGISYGLVVGEMFPSLGRTRAHSWLTAVNNVVNFPTDWSRGVVCTNVPVRYRFVQSKVRARGSSWLGVRCPEHTPYAVSGMFLPDTETTGQIRLGAFYSWPREGSKPPTAKGWVLAVLNVTDEPQRWLGGVVCSRQPAYEAYYTWTIKPGNTQTRRSPDCPRSAPIAVSGWFEVVTPSVIKQSQEPTGQLSLEEFYSPGYRLGRQWVADVVNVSNAPQKWNSGAMCMGPAAARSHAAATRPPQISIDEHYPTGQPVGNVSKHLCRKLWYRAEHKKTCRRYKQ